MVSIADLAACKAVALLSDMNQPLGNAVGNALELKEAIHTLKGDGPKDLLEHCLVVAGHMLALGGLAPDEDQGWKMAQDALQDGRGWERFKVLVAAQEGNVGYIEDPTRLATATMIEHIPAPRGGFLQEINARIVGETAVKLGAGRAKKGDPIDPAVGIIIHHKVGDYVEAGDHLFTIHANDQGGLDDGRKHLLDAHVWQETPVEPLPLFYGVVKI
jgi:pyrimidine-nucleoside phosphorylase